MLPVGGVQECVFELLQFGVPVDDLRAGESLVDLLLGLDRPRARPAHAVLPHPLGLVQRLVGRLDEMGRAGRVLRTGGNPDAQLHRDAAWNLFAAETLGDDSFPNLFGNGHPAVPVHVLEKDKELVAGEPDRVAPRWNRVTNDFGYMLEDEISLEMPVRVVDLLKAVEVKHDNREGCPALDKLVQAVPEILPHEPPVIEPRQLIEKDES